ncbi:MAG: SH3 domain-containing protein [Defluviitaleaceae bacterium]|nr:SH3 domain-containing protein [Defluviitaleaceae bacterium]MCL2276226.1 SH3 domain-containing protein [Defluviitaleaceae bacterium]
MKKAILFTLVLAVFMGTISTTAHAFALDLRCWEEQNPQTPQEGTPYLTLAALNLRPAPSTAVSRIALAPQGAVVQVLDYYNDEWYFVLFNGITGFMFAEFLEQLNTPSFTPPDISNLAQVELIDWQTANTLLTLHAPLTIIDVRTGISWQVARFGGELHADVETITAEDTAIMHHVFNYTWTWEPRPVLVVYNGRTLAASINGMPHGIVTNHRNNVNGHFCLHFHGSFAHGATQVDVRHHNALLNAFFTAQGW